MCLGVPALVVSVDPGGSSAVVDVLGARREVSTLLVEGLCIDDWVVVHVGFAIARVDPVQAASDLALLREALDADADASVPAADGLVR